MVRLEFVDYAKGLAILLVVIGHLLQYNLVGISAKELFDMIYSFHMPLFMFLSGYVASLSIDKYLSRKVEYPKTANILHIFRGIILTYSLLRINRHKGMLLVYNAKIPR